MNTKTEMIVIYGTAWCGDCKRAKAYFDRNQIPYEWIDIDRNPDARTFVEQTNHGNRSVPTIVFPNGDILVEPRESELAARFAEKASQN